MTVQLIDRTTRAHYAKYAQMAQLRGITLTVESLRFFGSITIETLYGLYQADQHLNNIPLTHFDQLTHAYNAFHRHNPITLAEGCCLYKHLLIYRVLGCEPSFTD